VQIKANLTSNKLFPGYRSARTLTALGFALVIGILLLSILGAYHTTTRHNVQLSALVRDAGMKTVYAYTMREAIRERIDTLRSMATQKDPFQRDAEKMRFFGYASKYVQARESLTQNLVGKRERRMIERLDASARKVIAPNEAALAALFDQTAGTWQTREAVRAAIDAHLALLGTLDALVRTIHQTTQRSIRTSGDEYHETVLTSALAGMAAFAVAIGIAAFVVINAGQRNRSAPHHAAYDTLTGLLNRQAFETSLGLTLEQCALRPENHALLFVDLDRFKLVNDTCGHRAGDRLLRDLSGRLNSSLRHADVLGRIGGNEFGVLLRYTESENAAAMAERLRRTIEDFEFEWGGQTFQVGASIGMVPFGDETIPLEELLSTADACCDSAKEEGRNRVHQANINPEAVRRRSGEMRWVARISDAIQNDRFVLFGQMIQPINGRLDDGRLVLEVLLRMRDDAGLGLIPPGQFLPTAERYGIVPDIDRWVVRNSLQWLAGLGAAAPQVRVNINICGPAASDPQFHDFVRDLISETGVPPKSLCFEITESTAIRSLDNAAALIDALGDLGCEFALDDFGSGLSSFNQLRHLKVDYLKIDGSFIHNIDRDPINRAMVESINSIGKKLGKKTVAEFVENSRIHKILAEIEVDYAQGFGLHRPEPLHKIQIQIMQSPHTKDLTRVIVA
jgi:diguanylate cyclase (GGDEF)-like protein